MTDFQLLYINFTGYIWQYSGIFTFPTCKRRVKLPVNLGEWKAKQKTEKFSQRVPTVGMNNGRHFVFCLQNKRTSSRIADTHTLTHLCICECVWKNHCRITKVLFYALLLGVHGQGEREGVRGGSWPLFSLIIYMSKQLSFILQRRCLYCCRCCCWCCWVCV